MLASSTFACSRTELDLFATGETPDAFAPPPPADIAACTFSPTATSTTPVLAAIAGQTLVGLTPQGTLAPLFSFAIEADVETGTAIVSRGDVIAAITMQTFGAGASPTTTEVELVVVRLDGTIVAHLDTTMPGGGAGGGVAAIGNAAGTFAFSATASEDTSQGFENIEQTWLTLSDGEVSGPVQGVAIGPGIEGPGFNANANALTVEPDTEGRVLAWSQPAQVPVWLDVRTGAQSPSVLLAETNASPSAVSAAVWGSELFGLTPSFDLATETAGGVTVLPHPAIATDFYGFWDFTPAGVAMFALPPHSGYLSTTNNLQLVNATTLASRTVSIAYPPGLSPAYPGAFLSPVNISTSPAGFGVDSQGRVTMFLTDGITASFEATEDGQTWTAIGEPVPLSPPSGIYVSAHGRRGRGDVSAGGTDREPFGRPRRRAPRLPDGKAGRGGRGRDGRGRRAPLPGRRVRRRPGVSERARRDERGDGRHDEDPRRATDRPEHQLPAHVDSRRRRDPFLTRDGAPRAGSRAESLHSFCDEDREVDRFHERWSQAGDVFAISLTEIAPLSYPSPLHPKRRYFSSMASLPTPAPPFHPSVVHVYDTRFGFFWFLETTMTVVTQARSSWSPRTRRTRTWCDDMNNHIKWRRWRREEPDRRKVPSLRWRLTG